MPIDQVTIVRMCAECRAEIETMTVKKDNMRLFSNETIWCPHCNADKPEVRDIVGRLESIEKETTSYPANKPVDVE